MQRVLHALGRVNAIVASVLFAALTAVVTLQVFTRFVLHIPFLWSEELARFLFFWVVLLGAALSVKNRRHFVIDVTGGAAQRTGRLRRGLFEILPAVCVLGFCVFLLAQGVGYVRVGLLRTATNSGLSMALVYAAIPMFAVLSVLYTAGNLLRRDAADATTPKGGE